MKICFSNYIEILDYTINTTNSEAKYWKMHHFFEYNKLLDIIMNEKNY